APLKGKFIIMNESLRLEVEKWIEEDPDPKTREQLTRWLNEDNESELRSCFLFSIAEAATSKLWNRTHRDGEWSR
ncbi:MAG: hypothetical protein EBY87_05395, partial [Actinobacteria bacterium]|nr:hypothetical protein [Actinomycetota bacterium]